MYVITLKPILNPKPNHKVCQSSSTKLSTTKKNSSTKSLDTEGNNADSRVTKVKTLHEHKLIEVIYSTREYNENKAQNSLNI